MNAVFNTPLEQPRLWGDPDRPPPCRYHYICPAAGSCTYAKSIVSSPGQHKQPSAATRKTQADASWHELLRLRPASRPAALRPAGPPAKPPPAPSNLPQQRAVTTGRAGTVPGEDGERETTMRNPKGCLWPQRVGDACAGAVAWTLSLGHVPCPCMRRMQDGDQDGTTMQDEDRDETRTGMLSGSKSWR